VAVPDRTAPEAVALTLLGIGSLQFGAALGVTLFDEATAPGAALARIAMAALVLLVVVRPSLRGRSRTDLRVAALFGLCLGTMNLSIYVAFDRIPLGAAVTIEFLGPLGVAALLSRRRRELMWVALAAAGVVLVCDPFGDPLDPLGVLLALLAGLAWGGYILVAQRAGQTWPGADGLAVAMAIGVLVPLVPGLVAGGDALLDPHVLAIALAVALLSSVVPYGAELEALRRMPARTFGVLMAIEPAVAALAGVAVLGQALGGPGWAGIALVVVASVGATRAPVPVAEA
jgi:inner membrane transporter RhtA